MKESAEKRIQHIEIDIDKIISLKRISDLFPQGKISEISGNPKAMDVSKIVLTSPLIKNIPNLANPANSICVSPQNSLSSQIEKRNVELTKIIKSELQSTFIKRIKPFNIVTLVLIAGWLFTILLLTFL
ncbi:MAG: hypothetical protein JW776_15040 [Candidatus Lokiarchaeota archaeon]|nr:hypothetical protein [Candidatus Lokiarchaeota archaeon]